MNRKRLFISIALAFVALSIQAQEAKGPGLRLDVGVDVPFTFGAILEGTSFEGSDIFIEYILPFPTASLNYFVPVGPLRIGGGIRGYTFIVETVFWPNLVTEFQLGPLVIQGQIGGGAFILFGILSTIQSGKVFFPDLAVYYQHNRIRFGAGALGIFVEALPTTAIPVVLYASAKFILN